MGKWLSGANEPISVGSSCSSEVVGKIYSRSSFQRDHMRVWSSRPFATAYDFVPAGLVKSHEKGVG